MNKIVLDDGVIYNINNYIQIIGKVYVNHKNKTIIKLSDDEYKKLINEIEKHIKL